MNLLSTLKASSRLFDAVKRASRLAGVRSPLYRRLNAEPRLRRSIRFIQVGANDGISYDPIREFIIRYGWTGIVIEPIPSICALLQRNYRAYPAVRALNCAVSYGQRESLTIYSVAAASLGRFPGHAAFVSSLDRGHLQREFLAIRNEDIVATSVDAMTLEAIAAKQGLSAVDFLAIDAEGSEADILLNADLATLRPQFILYEHAHIAPAERNAVDTRLAQSCYRLEPFGNDTLAVM